MGQKIRLTTLFLLLSFATSFAQDKYTYDFINEIQDYTPYYLTDTAFVTPLLDTTEKRELIEECSKFISKDEFLKMITKKSTPFLWDQKQLKNATCIKEHNNLSRDKTLIPERPILYISIPIFDSTKKYALVYIYHGYVGHWGGGGCTYFYQRDKDKWTVKATGRCVDF